MDHPGKLTRAAWAVVGLLWAVCLLNYLDRQLLVNMSGPVKAELRIDNERFGLFTSMFLWIYGLCSPFAGYLADRLGRHRAPRCVRRPAHDAGVRAAVVHERAQRRGVLAAAELAADVLPRGTR